MDSAGGLEGGHDARTRTPGNSLDVAGPAPAVPTAFLHVVSAGNSPAPSARNAEGAGCPCCGSQIDGLVLPVGMAPRLAAVACRGCGWGITANAGRHLKPLPEDVA